MDGLVTGPGDPLETVFSGRPIEEDAGSEMAISRARNWLKECNEHLGCSPSEMPLPSHVIDVGDYTHRPFVKLRETEGHEQGKYICLSYCWGKSREFTTTRATLEERKRQIMIADMPKTYQDAICMARELGVRYLWIDSLCICQDDIDNWERESAKMSSIYANAYLTIGASRARDTAEGFFGPRPPQAYVEIEYTAPGPDGVQGQAVAFSLPLHEEADPQDYVSMPSEPLSDRAWSLQERVLSHRMLHYGTLQMFFECSAGFRGEDGLSLRRRYHSVHPDLKDKSRETADEEVEKALPFSTLSRHKLDKGRAALLAQWEGLLWSYGTRKLTKASDKLPALSGLASIFVKRMPDEYIAGLWRSHLIEGLLWQGLGARRVSEYRAPSWSWASMDGIPGLGLFHEYESLAEVLDVKVNSKGANPYGEVTGGYIKLRAPLERLYLMLDEIDPTKPAEPYARNNPKVRTANGNPEGEYSRFDFAFRASDAAHEAQKIVQSLEGVEIFALILLKIPGNDEAEAGYMCLIVRKLNGGDEMQRLGFIHLDADTLGTAPAVLQGNSSVVTLV